MYILTQNKMDCGICCSRILYSGEIDCGHKFCFSCIDQWCKVNNVCVYCKLPVSFIRHGKYQKKITKPEVSYETSIMNYIYGGEDVARQRRNEHPRVPWSQQKDLRDFVVDDDGGIEYESDNEVSECIIFPEDSKPIYTRTRKRSVK